MIKCPFCQQEMTKSYNGGVFCSTSGCDLEETIISIETAQRLYATRKALETLQEFITKLYLNGNITDEQLERYKKMLIRALEQKE